MGLGKTVEIEKVKANGKREKLRDIIPVETLLKIYLNGKLISTISCSPNNEIELAVGYIISNEYLRDYSFLNTAVLCDDRTREENKSFDLIKKIDIEGKVPDDDFAVIGDARFITPGCGSIDDFILEKDLNHIDSRNRVLSGIILGLNKETLARQELKKESCGLHATALFTDSGKIICTMEDIGRHNCLDKIFGHMLINELKPEDKIVFTSGRISFDFIYKISRMSIPIAVTNSSISSSAISLAQKIGLTLIGYARGSRFNIYSSSYRII